MITRFQSDLPAGRRRLLAMGRHYADALEQVRARGLEAALELVDTMGGASQRMGLARQIERLVLAEPQIEPRRIVTRVRHDGVVYRAVEIPTATWRWKGKKQVAELDWWMVFEAPARLAGK